MTEIREDMLKVKRMISEVEITIGKREGETELVNKLIDAENLLTYCMSRLENAIVPPCKVGDTVYAIADCSRIMMYYDNDYLTGTGAIECPFEDVCEFTECNDENTQVIETCVSHLLFDDEDCTFGCEHINNSYNFNDFGKTVFLTREEAEKALAERRDSQ